MNEFEDIVFYLFVLNSAAIIALAWVVANIITDCDKIAKRLIELIEEAE